MVGVAFDRVDIEALTEWCGFPGFLDFLPDALCLELRNWVGAVDDDYVHCTWTSLRTVCRFIEDHLGFLDPPECPDKQADHNDADKREQNARAHIHCLFSFSSVTWRHR